MYIVLPAIRFFTHVYRWDRSELDWADIGFSYLTVLKLTGLPVRALPLEPVDWDMAMLERWAPLHKLFTTQIPDTFVNVVCGLGDEFDRLYTHKCPNVAITGILHRGPNPPEIVALRRFEHVVTWNRANGHALEALLEREVSVIEGGAPGMRGFLERVSCAPS